MVPRGQFVGDFPKPFVDEYVHWLDLETGEVEFRPVESPWTDCPSNWRLHTRTGDTWASFRRISGDSAPPVNLIDIRSATFRILSRLLSALESPERIVITHTNQVLEASLSRLRLVFFVNQNSELECRSMPGYVIDEFQSCGTMFGLKNRLVLRPRNGSLGIPRRVIIPQGDIEFGLDGDFASVSIDTGEARHVHWLDYTIDTDLGRLTGSVDLRSKLYQCYLHALTSHCLPDPLLGHTGTEESLNMLQSATSLSFQRLHKDDAKLLDLISNLTPIRAYYPPHLRSMVTVEWNDLPVLSQHHDFHTASLSILDYARSMETLYDKPVDFPDIRPREVSLLTRAASRNSVYYPHDLQSLRYSSSSTQEDVVHKSRDVGDEESAEHVAYQTSWSVWNAKPWLPPKWLELWNELRSWPRGLIGPAQKRIFSLRYSSYWLTFDPAKDWLGIYDICQELGPNPQDSSSRIRLAFSLSAASFSKCSDDGPNRADIVPLLLIFATDTRFRVIRPSSSHYDLSHGTKPERSHLQSMIYGSRLPMDQTPYEVRANEWWRAAEERRKREYYSTTKSKALEAAQTIVAQWPERRCNLPQEWFNTRPCTESIEAYLESISRNIAFADFIRDLQTIFNSYKTTAPPIATYLFSPQFSTRPDSPKAISPSLRDVLMARTNPPPTKEEDLGYLIQEFRNSRPEESLRRLYGDELQNSFNDLLDKSAHFLFNRGIPPREALRHHRDICCQKKDALFSEISAVLAPSQESEKIIGVSGLWPRITPRSILRELSRIRVDTLADQWKEAITRYAVAFLKYQQSQRLLELSSQNRDEEILREAESSCEKVAAACSPDWLLIQVSSFPHKKHATTNGRCY